MANFNNNDNADVQEKEQRIGDYIQSLAAVEEAMEPFKEQKQSPQVQLH